MMLVRSGCKLGKFIFIYQTHFLVNKPKKEVLKKIDKKKEDCDYDLRCANTNYTFYSWLYRYLHPL